MVIHLGRRLLAASSDLPDGLPERTVPGPRLGLATLFGLAPDGVYPATPVARGAVSSYLAFSPLLEVVLFRGRLLSGMFSVALSIPSPSLAVSQHPVLRCPDFPPAGDQGSIRQQPSNPLSRVDSWSAGKVAKVGVPITLTGPLAC